MAAEVRLRAPTLDDVPAATAMMNERGLALHGEPEMTEDELRGWFTLPSVELERDVRIALDDSGAVAGYADLMDRTEEGRRLWVDLRVRPGRADEAVTVALLDAMEARARERAVPGAAIRAVADEAQEPLRQLLEARGYRIARSSFRMATEFGGPPPAARPPDGIVVRPYRQGQKERDAYDVVMDPFSDGWDFTPQPYDEFLHWAGTADSDPTLQWLAPDGGDVAGACLCHPTAHGNMARGWIEMLAVRRPWRGRGLVRALLLTAFVEYHRRGQAGAALSVDAEDVTGAVGLYEGVGMHVVRRLDTYERWLDRDDAETPEQAWQPASA